MASELADIRARARIAARLDRLKAGNLGDTKPLRDGVSELRVDMGQGIASTSASWASRCPASLRRRHRPGRRLPGRLQTEGECQT